jgi:ferredoxin-NADP reductase
MYVDALGVAMSLMQPSSPSSLLAFFTTLHLALVVLRNHRSAGSGSVSSLACVSVLFAALPWVYPSALGLGFGMVMHVVWFGTCEVLAPVPARLELGGARATTPSAPPTTTAKPAPGPAPAAKPVAPRAAPPVGRPKGFVQVPVLLALRETPDIVTIRVARPEGFDFEAGQFIPVRIRVDGKDQVRCYSISSAPHVGGYLEISVKRQGVVSSALHTTARPGAVLSIRTPNGAFKYPSGDDRPIVLLGAGVGVTPLISMMRYAVYAEPTRPVTLLYGARKEGDFAFRDELVTLPRRHPQLKIQLAASVGASHPSIYPGRIDAALLKMAVPDPAYAVYFICGPENMIQSSKTMLQKLGVPAPQIRYELFQAAVASSASAAEEQAAGGTPGLGHGVPAAEASALAAPVSAEPAARAATLEMRCTKVGKSLQIRAGQTLLEGAEEHGVEIPSLCRTGVCGTCRARVTAGEVECDSTTLDADEQRQGIVLACVATPRTDCTVEV